MAMQGRPECEELWHGHGTGEQHQSREGLRIVGEGLGIGAEHKASGSKNCPRLSLTEWRYRYFSGNCRCMCV